MDEGAEQRRLAMRSLACLAEATSRVQPSLSFRTYCTAQSKSVMGTHVATSRWPHLPWVLRLHQISEQFVIEGLTCHLSSWSSFGILIPLPTRAKTHTLHQQLQN